MLNKTLILPFSRNETNKYAKEQQGNESLVKKCVIKNHLQISRSVNTLQHPQICCFFKTDYTFSTHSFVPAQKNVPVFRQSVISDNYLPLALSLHSFNNHNIHISNKKIN